MLISENRLDNWVRGDAEDAQGVIVELTERLLSASCPNAPEMRFPRRDSIGQPGHDGVLVTDVPFPPFVPKGRSVWAIGTGDVPRKATSDYKVSTLQESAATRRKTTFVFVTPLSGRKGWTQSAQATWRNRRRAKREWKDVRVIDGTQLIAWLDKLRSVELWLAEEMGVPSRDIEALEQHWAILTTIGSPPPLPTAVFLANRDSATARLRDLFAGTISELQIGTHYPDQVIPFVSSYVASLPDDRRREVNGRSLIIKNADAWKAVMDLPRHVLVADFDVELQAAPSDMLLQRAKNAGHSVIYHGPPGGPPFPNRTGLPTPSITQIKDALQNAGYPEERARAVAQKSNGNLTFLLRILRDVSSMPEWGGNTAAAHLAVAEMLGSWNEALEADQAIAEQISGKAYGEWIAEMRKVVTRAGTPLIQSFGVWKFIARYEGWYALGPKLFDEHVDRLSRASIAVLRENDPQFDLPPNERFAANIRGKSLSHSRFLRTGLAESLALLGSHPKALTSSTPGKAESTAAQSVRAILESADWARWASLNDVLPLLAEAAPEEFMGAIEASLQDDRQPFRAVFAQEGEAVTGWNFMTGVLWGLETIAWEPDYLIRAATLLAELAAQDPGGKWSNRPANSLATIFLPWFPQTIASAEKRHLAVETIVNETPDVAWHLLLDLLPQSHSTSMGTRKPSWRLTIPEDWKGGTTVGAYWQDVRAFADQAFDLARTDMSKLAQLVERLDDLPPPARESVVEHLRSETLRSAPAEERLKVWASLKEIASKHRKFRDAKWAMPEDQLTVIESVANDLTPDDPSLRNRRLFSERDFELYEGIGNWQEQAARLDARREESVREIHAAGDVDAVVAFARTVESPWRVGLALGAVKEADLDDILPALLNDENKSIAQFIGGVVMGRFRTAGWKWADETLGNDWTTQEKAQFLAYFPFSAEAWTRAASVLGENVRAYWERTTANPYQAESNLPEAVDQLLRFGRPLAAVRCLARLVHDKQQIRSDQAIPALLAAARTTEPTGGMDSFEIIEVIKALQEDPATEPDRLMQVEWVYLPGFDAHKDVWPKTLESRLARDPSLFTEILGLLYRSKNEPKEKKEPSPEQEFHGKRAFRLLHTWRIPPGTSADGTLDEAALSAWLKEVKAKTAASGHLEVAMISFGHVLIHSPADPSGLWIHRAVAAILNAKDAEDIRSGFVTELYNARGVHFVDPSGKEERTLAQEYRTNADAVEKAGYHRLATSLRELADSYDREAERLIKEAESDG